MAASFVQRAPLGAPLASVVSRHMTQSLRFNAQWEPAILEEEEMATGTWLYQDTVKYAARLIRRKWDYSASDIEDIEKNVPGINIDYLDYAIGEDGNIFFWAFEGPTGKTQSSHFPTYTEALAHIATYAGTASIAWSAE